MGDEPRADTRSAPTDIRNRLPDVRLVVPGLVGLEFISSRDANICATRLAHHGDRSGIDQKTGSSGAGRATVLSIPQWLLNSLDSSVANITSRT